MDADVLVVGAGAGGLAVAACLRRRGVDVLVVDRGGAVGDSGRARYDRLEERAEVPAAPVRQQPAAPR